MQLITFWGKGAGLLYSYISQSLPVAGCKLLAQWGVTPWRRGTCEPLAISNNSWQLADNVWVRHQQHPLQSTPCSVGIYLVFMLNSLHLGIASTGFWLVTISRKNCRWRVNQTNENSHYYIWSQGCVNSQHLPLLPYILDFPHVWLAPPLV